MMNKMVKRYRGLKYVFDGELYYIFIYDRNKNVKAIINVDISDKNSKGKVSVDVGEVQ